MKTSCINHPSRKRIAILREDYLDICDGHIGAAFLLSFFEYWQNIKLSIRDKAIEENNTREKHGDSRSQNESLFQFHTQQDILDALLGSVGRPAIESGLKLLVDKKYISVHSNPNPRYKFDKTKHFLFYSEVVNQSIIEYYEPTETAASSHRNCDMHAHKLLIAPTETVTYPKITPKITNKNKEKEINNYAESFEEFYQQYPKKVGKQAALKAWIKLHPSSELIEKIKSSLARQKESEQWIKDSGKYIPHPATWLNGRRWEDEVQQEKKWNEA